MAEPTASLGFDEIEAEIGLMLGWTATLANWSVAQLAQIGKLIQTGLRRFYFPEPLPGERTIHEWSFLKPVDTLVIWPDVAVDATVLVTGVHVVLTDLTTLTATAASFYPSMIGRSVVVTGVGTFTITAYTSATVVVVAGNATCAGVTFSIASNGQFRLPEDYGGIEGPFTLAADEGWHSVPVVSEVQIRKWLQSDASSTGRPQKAAIRAVTFDADVGQRWEAYIWPSLPDSVYNLTYRKIVLLDNLAAAQYGLGGMPHSETVKSLCLAAAEETMDDTQGLWAGRAARQLAASIAFDRRNAPETLGYNSDGPSRGVYDPVDYVTYDDVLYDSDPT